MVQGKSSLLGLLVVIASFFCFSLSATASAQEDANGIKPGAVKPSGVTVQLPVFAVTKVTTTVSIPDAGFHFHGARKKRRSAKQLLAQFESKTPPEIYRYYFNSKTVTTDAPGTATYDIIHNFKPLKIVTYDSGKIQMQLVRHYSDGNLDELTENHPEIAMHINGLPDSLNNYAKVKLSLDIESNVTVDNLKELAEKHPSLYLIHQRWVKPLAK